MDLLNILSHFSLPGEVLDAAPYGDGHVNKTFVVATAAGRFILQRVSTRAYADIPGVMANIAAVTAHLRQKDPDPRHSLRLIPTREGESCWRDAAGAYWRCSAFVEGGRAPRIPPDAAELREVGRGWGHFLSQLSDFPLETLRPLDPDFHNTPRRYGQLRAALEADPLGRAGALGREIDQFLAWEEAAARLQTLREAGELPLRLCHNDTKLDNLLLDAGTGEALCVLDLDTLLPGLTAYDFGDTVRSAVSKGGRDRWDPERLSAFAGGFREAFPAMTAPEGETLALGAWTMTVECGVRYLTDYLEGEYYFAAGRPGHCLDRARTYLHLARDMQSRRAEMERAIKNA